MFGPEFLVWIPSVSKFATIFLGSKSSRRIAPDVKALLMEAATFGSQKVELTSHTYFTNNVTACSTPVTPPDTEVARVQMVAFANPPAPDVELADVASTDGGRAR